jgi:D-sedoheptulose 7-phosphate isomerase
MFDTRQHLDDFVRTVKHLDLDAVGRMSAVVYDTWARGRTVFCCGNGGSAASASHFAADLTKLTASARHPRRVRAVALTESLSAISAIANDFSYEEIFVEQLRPFMQPGDVLLGFSTSGSSPNVLRAVEFANDGGAITLGIAGRNGTKLAALAHETMLVDSTSVQHIEDATMVAGHIICLQVKDRIADLPRGVAQPHANLEGVVSGAVTM